MRRIDHHRRSTAEAAASSYTGVRSSGRSRGSSFLVLAYAILTSAASRSDPECRAGANVSSHAMETMQKRVAASAVLGGGGISFQKARLRWSMGGSRTIHILIESQPTFSIGDSFQLHGGGEGGRSVMAIHPHS